MGFVVSGDKTKPLYRELLRHREDVPTVNISESRTIINELEYDFTKKELEGAKRFMEYAQQHKELHMYLTSHFCYPPRTRIVTFSPKKPPIILYKEISPIKLILS
jgi:thymidine kinase